MMMPAAAQQPDASDIHRQSKAGDRNGFGEMDWNRRKKAADGLIADQERDHRQNNGAAESCQIAQLGSNGTENRLGSDIDQTVAKALDRLVSDHPCPPAAPPAVTLTLRVVRR
jgi:hypothetical protein